MDVRQALQALFRAACRRQHPSTTAMQQQPYQSSPFQDPGATTAALDGLNESSQPFLDGFAAELLQGQGSLPLGDDLFAGLPQPAFPASPHPSPAANGLQYVQVASGVPLDPSVETQHVSICARPRRTESHACLFGSRLSIHNSRNWQCLLDRAIYVAGQRLARVCTAARSTAIGRDSSDTVRPQFPANPPAANCAATGARHAAAAPTR